MVIKRLLQLYPELVRTKEYAGVRIRLIKLFQMGEMERMSWGRLKTRNIGEVMAASLEAAPRK